MNEELESMQAEQPEPEKKAPKGRELFEWLQMLLCCVVGAVLVFNLCARLSRVDGQSMDYTLQHNELLLVWSLGYSPKPGDIVIINKTTADFLGEHAIVKRVIATGGQTVDIDYATSTVYVDGQPLDEPYIAGEMYLPNSPYMLETHFEVPEDEVFVMGDNRYHSTDSRANGVGTVDIDSILGKVIFRFLPFDKFGAID